MIWNPFPACSKNTWAPQVKNKSAGKIILVALFRLGGGATLMLS